MLVLNLFLHAHALPKHATAPKTAAAAAALRPVVAAQRHTVSLVALGSVHGSGKRLEPLM